MGLKGKTTEEEEKTKNIQKKKEKAQKRKLGSRARQGWAPEIELGRSDFRCKGGEKSGLGLPATMHVPWRRVEPFALPPPPSFSAIRDAFFPPPPFAFGLCPLFVLFPSVGPPLSPRPCPGAKGESF